MWRKIDMKTIIKYELVINEALRSALNYDTPDEQINEFICFLGSISVLTESTFLKIVRKDIAQIIPMNGVRKELSLKSMPCRTLIWM